MRCQRQKTEGTASFGGCEERRGKNLSAHRGSAAIRTIARCALWSIDIPIIREVPGHLRQAAAAIFGQVLRLVEPFREVKEVLIRVLDVEVETECVEQ